MLKKQCNNECGNSWCCSRDVSLLYVNNVSEDDIELFITKGIDVYYFPKWISKLNLNLLYLVYTHRCIHLTDNGCDIKYSQKPKHCRAFPSKETNTVLPIKCKYHNDSVFTAIEDLIIITQDNFKDIKYLNDNVVGNLYKLKDGKKCSPFNNSQDLIDILNKYNLGVYYE